MSDLTINIKEYDDPAALMRPDSSLTSSQETIFLTLDPKKRTVGVKTLTEQQRDGTPMGVYHGRRYRMRLPDDTDASKIREWAEEHTDLFATIFDGHSVSWDGSNRTGSLDDAANKAKYRLRALISDQHEHPSPGWLWIGEFQQDKWDLDKYDIEPVDRSTVDVPTHDVHLIEAGKWASPAEEEIIEDYDLSEDTSEERLEEVARELEEDARTMDTKLYGTLNYLKGLLEATSIR